MTYLLYVKNYYLSSVLEKKVKRMSKSKNLLKVILYLLIIIILGYFIFTAKGLLK